MWLEQRLGTVAMTGGATGGKGRVLRRDSNTSDRDGAALLRHMAFAAAIALGLVALWLGLMQIAA